MKKPHVLSSNCLGTTAKIKLIINTGISGSSSLSQLYAYLCAVIALVLQLWNWGGWNLRFWCARCFHSVICFLWQMYTQCIDKLTELQIDLGSDATQRVLSPSVRYYLCIFSFVNVLWFLWHESWLLLLDLLPNIYSFW